MGWYEEMIEEIRESELPLRIFQGSCDFYLAWEQLAAQRRTAVARANRVYASVQASAACASMALELALKCRISLEGKKPRREHEFHILFEQLDPATQDDIASRVHLDGKRTNTADLIDALKRCEGTFVTWRYVHEHENADFYEGWISEVTRALHRSMLEANPDFWLWPGIDGATRAAPLDANGALEIVKRAVSECFREAPPLPESVHERTITHRLAIYLENEVRQLDARILGVEPREVFADCEYNRDGPECSKKLFVLAEISRSGKPRHVFPDIIVHKRGEDGPNLIVIEAKKRSDASRRSIARDEARLRLYVEEFDYDYAFFVLFDGNAGEVFPVRTGGDSTLADECGFRSVARQPRARRRVGKNPITRNDR